MGQGICGCHAAEKAWQQGKAVSQDHLLSLPKRNGYAPFPTRPRYYSGSNTLPNAPPSSSTDALMASSPGPFMSARRNMEASNPALEVNPVPYVIRPARVSSSTLGESGISSKGSSTFDDSAAQSLSAPSSPHIAMRRKPPPKPPRLRSYGTDTGISVDSKCTLSPTLSVRSAGVSSLKSSIADVTSSLDNTLTRSFENDDFETSHNGSGRNGPSQQHREKVCNILTQTKEFLAFELETDGVLHYLRQQGVISSRTESDIKRCHSKIVMCEKMLDLITNKGHMVFEIFCEALRTVGSQGYLADLLEVLDSLVEIATCHLTKPAHLQHHSTPKGSKAGRTPSNAEEPECPLCMCNNNCDFDDVFGDDDANFDIDICYVNRDTGHVKSMKDFSGIRRARRPLSVTSEDSLILDETDRYIPMVSLNLYNQCLNNRGILGLAYLLEHYPCIRDMSLAKNHLGVQGMIKLGEALERNKGLYKLDIRLNSIGDEGALHLAQGIRRHVSLRKLNVSSTSLSGSGCTLLMRGLAHSKSLSELDIGFNDLDDNACEALADVLASNCSLRKLRMRSNGVRTYGGRRIFKALKKNARLSYLDISCNKIGDESMAMLGDVLLYNRTLREINLENTNVSRDGCVALARALKTNMVLKKLDLSMNPLQDAGVEALSEGLKYNQIMDTLCMNMCAIGNRGFLKLLDSLSYNVTLSTLKLCYNNIGSTSDESTNNGRTSTCNGRTRCHADEGFLGNGHQGNDEFLQEPSVEELYEELCHVLQLNKDLKVLLWGNKFEETGRRDSVQSVGAGVHESSV